MKTGDRVAELQVSQWFNCKAPLSLAALSGQVVAVHAFQMLCPGCVSHGLPQMRRLHEQHGTDGLTVIGLHSVFEHHAAMNPEALRAFIHEYRLRFPIAVDAPDPASPLPLTMQALQLRGTPSLLLIDRGGRLRFQHFGRLEDLELGLRVGQLLTEKPAHDEMGAGVCNEDACSVY